MTARRRILLVAAAAVAALLALALSHPPRISKQQSFAAVPGMTLAEVESLFGGAGEALLFVPDPRRPDLGVPQVDLDQTNIVWTGDEAFNPAMAFKVWRGPGKVYIFRFENGVLAEPGFEFGAAPTFLDRLRARLRL